MTKQTFLSVLAIVLVIAYFLSYTGLYGTGRTVGIIDMVLVFALLLVVLMLKRSARKPPT